MKLSKECIELIQHHSEERASRLYDQNSQNVSEVMEWTQWDNRRHNYEQGATEALTNPSIYEKAGLISLEDAFGFAEWLPKQLGIGYSIEDKAWFSNSGKSRHEIAQLFQIYQEQKEK